jgi:hypothetical protein
VRSTSRLLLEVLEDRCTPSSLAQPWPNPGHLTLSFVPDGTLLSGAPSNLFGTLNHVATTSQWQQIILKAFQTWAVQTNVNVGVVSDNGAPLGTDGAVQGDARFGDIRVGMQALPASLVATTSPFEWTGSTWSGDVILNSSYKFTIGGTGGYDLFTVALHEAGHALGIPDNTTDKNSIMYASYLGPRTGLDSLDVANIHTLYGSRTPDAFDAAAPNNSLAAATPLGNAPEQLGFLADLTTAADVDFYKLVTPLSIGSASVTIQIGTAGLSGLVPTLSVYNPSGQLLARGSGANALGGNVSVTLNNALPLTTLYFEVSHAWGGVFAIGGYSGQVTYNYLLSSIVGIVPQLIPGVVNTVNHVNTSIASATMLTAPWGSTTDQRFNDLYQANLVYGGDADYYKFQSPAAASPSGSYALDAIVWQTDPGGLAPALHLFDANGNPLAAQMLADTPGVFTVQVLGAAPGTLFYLEVVGQTTSGAGSTGGYVCGVKFNVQPEPAATLLGGNTLPAATSTDTGVMAMNQNGVFYFELAAATAGSASSVTMTVTNAQGQAVLSLSAAAAAPPRTAAVYLPAGVYTMHYSISAGYTPPGPTIYWLLGKILSDPIGPYYSGTNPPPSSTDTTSPPPNGNPTTSATTTFVSSGATVNVTTPDGTTTSLPIPAPGASNSWNFTTAAGTTTVTLTTDTAGNTTLTLTTPSSNTITDNTTTSGSTTTETITTSDGIQVTITMPSTSPAPSYAGPTSTAPPPYYY